MTTIPLARILGQPNPPGRNKLSRYRRALRRGDVFPPIIITPRAGGGYEIVQGVHRFHAHRLEGRKTIRTVVITRWIDPDTGELIDRSTDEARRAAR